MGRLLAPERDYLREAWDTLYRALCQRIVLVAETERLDPQARALFMVRALPALLFAPLFLAALTLLATYCLEVRVSYPDTLVGMAGGVLAGAATGIAVALTVSVPWGIAMDVALGVAASVVWGVALGVVVLNPIAGMALRATTGVGLGLAVGVALRVAVGTTPNVLLGAGLAMVAGLALGLAGDAAVTVAEGATRGGAAWAGAAIAAAGAGAAASLCGYLRLEWYAFDAARNLGQLTRAQGRPADAVRLFKRSPIYWREPIWLPLPGLRAFLRLIGEQDYQAGVEECLLVISRRPTQARVARAALADITLYHFARARTVREIARAAAGLDWARGGETALPIALQTAVPRLQDLGLQADQYLSATIPHTRRQALEKLRDGAANLSLSYAALAGPVSSGLVAVARQWQTVAAARLEELDREEEAKGWIHNPFVFGNPIEATNANLFVGRRDVAREIEVNLLGGTQKPALVLWGPRRMGKTSVLLQLPRLLGPQFAPAFVDLQAVEARESIAAFLHTLTSAAADALARRGVEARPLERSELRQDAFSVLADWLAQVENKLGADHYLLLCLDEYERLEVSILGQELPRHLLDEIRHIIQHHPRIVILLAGSHRPRELQLPWSDALISTKLIRVGYLKEEEARQLITQPVPGFPITYHEDSVVRIVEVTRGQPNLVQAVCFELVNLLNVEGRREARPADVEAAVAQALESAENYFAEMWGQLTEAQKQMLREIAHREAGATASELAATSGVDPNDLASDLRALAERSIVERVGDAWRFQVPMVREWVRTRSEPVG